MDANFSNSLKKDILAIEANRRAHVVAELTGLSLMIEAGLVSLEDVLLRLEKVRLAMPPAYRTPEVALRVNFVAGVLIEKYGAGQRRQPPEVLRH